MLGLHFFLFDFTVTTGRVGNKLGSKNSTGDAISSEKIQLWNTAEEYTLPISSKLGSFNREGAVQEMCIAVAPPPPNVCNHLGLGPLRRGSVNRKQPLLFAIVVDAVKCIV